MKAPDSALHIDAVREEYVPDGRSGIFEIRLEPAASKRARAALVLTGQTTHDEAVTELLRRLRADGLTVRDSVTRLPDAAVGPAGHALVRAAVAPLYVTPRLPASQISELVLGMRVEVLSRDGDWLRIRAEDGYLGWVHAGYVEQGSPEWTFAWERGTAGEAVVSLGAELVDDDGRTLARLPWGARLARHSGSYQLPDGRRGTVVNGEVIDVDRLLDRSPPRGESVARKSRRWLGTPYLWGGVTPAGADCSGFTQAVMWMHGIALPRDSDLQERTGAEVEVDEDFAALRPGDLVYFAEAGARVSHVAFSLGGAQIIHAALSNGGVHTNDLTGLTPFEQRLRQMLVRVRRMLPEL
ncbi:C40 family peptidase [soil metagenome]